MNCARLYIFFALSFNPVFPASSTGFGSTYISTRMQPLTCQISCSYSSRRTPFHHSAGSATKCNLTSAVMSMPKTPYWTPYKKRPCL
ncbi:hypothetical protein K523DRAFT_81153 [Schizophyllum commune Tattone D]|nr:hypothetical protein K523DRAFT_81153 [Schizophyllum commune Tattone D]